MCNGERVTLFIHIFVKCAVSWYHEYELALPIRAEADCQFPD